MTQKMIHLGSALLLAMVLAAFAPSARTQVLPSPCCSITAIDSHTGVISAKVNASGAAFQFEVTQPKILAVLRVGQSIYANFATKEVSLDGKTFNCPIIPTLPPKSLSIPAVSAGVAASLGSSQKVHSPAVFGPVVPAVGCPGKSGPTDLVITALGFDPARHVVYTIANCGSTATNLPFVVDLYMNGQRADTIEQKTLLGFSQQAVTSELAVDPGCAPVTLLAVADPQHIVSESSSDSHQKAVQITPPCPNLVVTEIKQVWVDLNTRYEVQFSVQNQGSGPAPIAIYVRESVAYLDGVSMPYDNDYSLNPLQPGQSATFHDSKKHVLTETIDVEVIIDIQHQINVSNPNNNISKKTLGPH